MRERKREREILKYSIYVEIDFNNINIRDESCNLSCKIFYKKRLTQIYWILKL